MKIEKRELRDVTMSMRMTAAQAAEIKLRAKYLGCSITEYMLSASLQAKMPHAVGELPYAAWRKQHADESQIPGQMSFSDVSPKKDSKASVSD